MSEAVAERLARIQGRGRALAGWTRARGYELAAALMLALGLGAVAASGLASTARTRALRAEAARLERLREPLARWQAAPHSASSAETAEWETSRREVEALAPRSAEPLALTRLVAARAAEVGVAELHVRLLERDSVDGVRSAARGSWTIDTGAAALRVGFRGSMGEVIGFLGSLPPHLAVAELTVLPASNGAVQVDARLLTRRVAAR
jgi:hypothetical protein